MLKGDSSPDATGSREGPGQKDAIQGLKKQTQLDNIGSLSGDALHIVNSRKTLQTIDQVENAAETPGGKKVQIVKLENYQSLKADEIKLALKNYLNAKASSNAAPT